MLTQTWLPSTAQPRGANFEIGREASRRLPCRVFVYGFAVLFLAWPPQECGAQAVSFREQIQPLLSHRCFACHGPDENTRQADLRLDTETGAKIGAITVGRADESELIARIESDDPELVMPPHGHGKPLTAAERTLLRNWIDQGAKWQSHWAFESIQQPDLPPDDGQWSKSPIDRFVYERMQLAGLKPSSPADTRTLIRRVYLDLVGTPPTPDQLQQFANDESDVTFEMVVDQLLASPHYGEHMAVNWLDVARYADTNGFQNDFVRSMWGWRDWVIAAYNKNMPYDQFITEQIAGDLLHQPTTSQLIASGFNRNNPSVTEGGSIEEEWRIENGIDRAETTAAAFLGLTVGCARCHDHKYDPVSQQEFFEFFAFFNNIDEQGVYSERRGNTPPLIRTPTPEQLAAQAALDQQIATLASQISAAQQADASTELNKWTATVERAADAEIAEPFWAFDTQATSASEWSPAGLVLSMDGDSLATDYEPPALQFERDQPFSWTGWIHGDARGAIWGKMDENSSYRGADTMLLGDGRLKFHLISNWDSNAIAVLSAQSLPPEKWNHVAVTYDGSSKAAGVKIYFDGQPAASTIEKDSLTETSVTQRPFKIGQRSRSEYLRGRISNIAFYDSNLTQPQVALQMKSAVVVHVAGVDKLDRESSVTAAAMTLLRQHQTADILQAKTKLETQRTQLIEAQQTTMVMRERAGEYRPTWVLNRGQYDQPVKDVDLWPGIPKVLPQLAEDQPRNRLGLARWLVDDRNPLVARVVVNQTWLKFFGRGLVDSADNFGVQGSPPSHPKLLDWLADDFRKHGWDLKRLNRQIVLSATYQQSSGFTDEKLKLDRDNRWLSRGPRYRLSAEQIRDSALQFSGLLHDKIGGPSVFPYQPDGLWDELAGGANNGPYTQSSGPELYRRSLYTYRKRTVSHPTTSTFDAPSWEKCQIKRARTNTPLQALALLNDTTYVEAARKFGERILQHGGKTLDDRVEFAVLVALSRPPTALEKSTLKQGFQHYFEFYQSHPEEAEQLLKIGQATSAPSNSAELAAITSMAAVILNLDKTMTKE